MQPVKCAANAPGFQCDCPGNGMQAQATVEINLGNSFTKLVNGLVSKPSYVHPVRKALSEKGKKGNGQQAANSRVFAVMFHVLDCQSCYYFMNGVLFPPSLRCWIADPDRMPYRKQEPHSARV